MKHKIATLFIILLLENVAYASRNYYVAPNGRDTYPGTESRPFASIQHAANLTIPGDTVFVKNGTYTKYNHAGNSIEIKNSGEPDAFIVFMAYPGHCPKIISPTWNAVYFGDHISYVEWNGFELEGRAHAMSDSSGNGIHINNAGHHIRILNNTVHHFPGGGIGANNCDYLHIEGNTVHHNAFYSTYQNSGISLYQCINYDDAPGYHNIIRGNTCYANENRVKPSWYPTITDGNGIIIDDGRNTQNNSPYNSYTAWTLVENNVIFDNGGRGIHCYLSDNVVVVNNTLYQNQRSKEIRDGELTAMSSNNIIFHNNIVYPSDNGQSNNTYNSTNITYDYNLYFNTDNIDPIGANAVIGDPLFLSATTNPNDANFDLTVDSPAINNGTNEQAPNSDFAGRPRHPDDKIDIGAFEFQFFTEPTPDSSEAHSIQLTAYPNPVHGETVIRYQLTNPDYIKISIYNSIGQKVIKLTEKYTTGLTNELKWNACQSNTLPSPGVYFIRLETGTGHSAVKKILFMK